MSTTFYRIWCSKILSHRNLINIGIKSISDNKAIYETGDLMVKKKDVVSYIEYGDSSSSTLSMPKIVRKAWGNSCLSSWYETHGLSVKQGILRDDHEYE